MLGSKKGPLLKLGPQIGVDRLDGLDGELGVVAPFAQNLLEDALALLEPFDVLGGEIDKLKEVRLFQGAVGASKENAVGAFALEAVLDAEKLEAERADGVVGALLPKATGRDVREYGDAVATTHESLLSACLLACLCLLSLAP